MCVCRFMSLCVIGGAACILQLMAGFGGFIKCHFVEFADERSVCFGVPLIVGHFMGFVENGQFGVRFERNSPKRSISIYLQDV